MGRLYEPRAADDAGAEEHVDDGVGDAVKRCEALNEQSGVVFALHVVVVQEVIDVEQVVDEVRTPAEYER